MNKLIIFLIALISFSALVNAEMSASDECKTYCTNTMYPVAVFTSTSEGFVKDASVEDSVFDISVISDTNTADWTSNLNVFCVVSKEGNNYYSYPQGLQGTINSKGEPITSLTFCSEKVIVSNSIGSSHRVNNFVSEERQVPEFGFITGSLAIAGACAGLLILRRKN